jgi:membrane dipeptidase
MNKLGLAIDVSHSGDRTAMDVIEKSTKPIFITHCGSQIVAGDEAALADEIDAMARERGIRAEIAYDGMEVVLRGGFRTGR